MQQSDRITSKHEGKGGSDGLNDVSLELNLLKANQIAANKIGRVLGLVKSVLSKSEMGAGFDARHRNLSLQQLAATAESTKTCSLHTVPC